MAKILRIVFPYTAFAVVFKTVDDEEAKAVSEMNTQEQATYIKTHLEDTGHNQSQWVSTKDLEGAIDAGYSVIDSFGPLSPSVIKELEQLKKKRA